jgi:hypothetical protein
MVRNSFPQNGPELPGIPYPPPGMGPDSAVRELPLAIQDRAFDIFNQLYYPKQTTLPAADALPNGPVPPTWVPGQQLRVLKRAVIQQHMWVNVQHLQAGDQE